VLALVVMSIKDVCACLTLMRGTSKLMAELMYGAGLQVKRMRDVAGEGYRLRPGRHPDS
jgi:hypothetical protein